MHHENRIFLRAGVSMIVWGWLLLMPGGEAHGQVREMRAVWLTTLSGLDWPASSLAGRPEEQKASLRVILDDCRRMGLNTIFLQVRSRGNAFYRSTLEPWAGELTGTLGRDPGWDPLAFAIEECHARGLDLHVWVNVFKVWSGSGDPPWTQPRHILHAHPEWVTAYKGEQWIDPGIPEARAWLVELFTDIVKRYDLDGIHLDYTRYPESDFSDDLTWTKSGSTESKGDWRRANVTAFIRDLHAAVTTLKPRCIIGAAPIGIYTNLPTARGWEGRNVLGQDSRAWLRDGICDYVVPQVYWGRTRHGSRIDFDALAQDWATHASGRHAVIGIAAYRDEVAPWLDEHVVATREAGAHGQAYFRYQHVASGTKLATVYADPALPLAYPWKDPIRPNPPRPVAQADPHVIQWQEPVPAPDGETADRYAVYRSSSSGSPELLAVVSSSLRQWPVPTGMTAADLSVTALDRVRNESTPLRMGALPAQPLLAAAPSTILVEGISRPVDAGDRILLAYAVASRAPVRIRLLESDGTLVSTLVQETQNPGTYILSLVKEEVPQAASWYVFEAGITVQEEELSLDAEDE